MKHKKLISCLCAAVLAFLLGFGSVSCMVTGLGLPADLFLLALGCATGALIAAVCFSLRWGSLILGGIAAIYSLISAFSFRFWEQLRAMCFSAVSYYNRGYGIPIPEWINGCVTESQLLPLLLIAGLVMTVAVRTVLRRKRAFPAVAAALVPLISCLIVTDTVPEILPIFLLLLGLVLLMMTQSVRRQDEAQGNRLTGIMILPVTAALLGLTLWAPQGDYSVPNQMDSLQEILDWLAQRLPIVEQTSQGELVISIGGTADDEVNLAQMGQRIDRNTPVMELVTDYSGTLLLRSRDYDVYTGLGWKASADRTEEGYGPSKIWLADDEQVSIRVLGRRGQFYLPCYPAEDQTLTGGMLPNPDYANTYTYTFSSLRDNWQTLYLQCENGMIVPEEPSADGRYLALPDKTRQQADELLKLLSYDDLDTYNAEAMAQAIGSYVRNSANYDLNTGRMPGSETDFVIWFLNESDTGYCVHFASAATVLLRAAGIPARYVEGYAVDTQSGQTTIVRERMAHAWVEYYLDYIGWVILDPTPGSSEVPEETTATTESTTAPTTPPSTDGSDPTPSATESVATTVPDTSGQPGKDPGTTSPSHIIGPSADTGSGGGAPTVVPPWFLNLLAALVCITVIGLLIVGQWCLRRHLKLKRMRRGKPNAQALARYREAKLIARLQGISVPDELLKLAEKAKFSQHQLTKEELGIFDTFLRDGIQAMQKKDWYYRLICRLIFAVY